jgi:hypothetical protein
MSLRAFLQQQAFALEAFGSSPFALVFAIAISPERKKPN